ncbi:hypothetical protein BLA29_010215 [Euroglyphus maynei]|uniref:Uncharacterized protein n=1 Tax=Euroglyphus maynei TaxID=6958 RepID=A0A1Y3B8E6_EURMA|nr:hypothetical protein BLA29_010215 [Euroglyphus maynei]
MAKFYPTTLHHWNEKIFDNLTDSNFGNLGRYLFFLYDGESDEESFIIVTYDWRTFVYGRRVCSWLSLTHEKKSVREIQEMKYRKLKQIDWGENFFVILTENGDAYMASCKNSKWKTRQSLKPLSPYRFNMIACGCDHILLLRDDGKLFTMGDNEYDQLGEQYLASSFITMVDTRLSNVKRIFCGSYYSIAVMDNHEK